MVGKAVGKASSRSGKPKSLKIALRVATQPIVICTGAAFVAFSLAAVAGSYLTNPKSVIVAASPPVHPIISVPEASAQFLTDATAARGSAQTNLVPSPTLVPSPALPKTSGLQPFTSTEPATTVPPSTQKLQSPTSLTQNPLFWTCGAIVMGCITGCMMISRQLSSVKTGVSKKAVPSRSKVFVPLPPAQMPVLGYGDQLAVGYSSAPIASLPASEYAVVPTLRQPAVAKSRKQRQPVRANNSRPTMPSAPTYVTVLPQTAVHPLDWNDPGLASQLDIRKSRPLSSWQ